MKVYRKIAFTFEAYKNCIQTGNTLWEEKHLDTLKHIAEEYLPHGSGFNNGVEIDIETSRKDRVVLRTAFHHMDENGTYERWTDHLVIIVPSLMFDFNLKITGQDYKNIKDYMQEIFGCALLEDYAEEPAKV